MSESGDIVWRMISDLKAMGIRHWEVPWVLDWYLAGPARTHDVRKALAAPATEERP